MLLNLYIIRDFLEDITFSSSIHSPVLDRSLARACLYSGEEEPVQQDIVYISTVECFQNLKNIPQYTSWMLLGTPDSCFLKPDIDVIFTDCVISQSFLMNRTMELFIRFCDWESKLQNCIVNGNSLQDLGNCSIDFLRNPFSLYTTYFQMVFCCERKKPRNLQLFSSSVTGTILTQEAANELRFNPEYPKSLTYRTPMIFPSANACPWRNLYQNIWVNNCNVARLLVSEVDFPIRDSDYPVLEIFCDYLALLLKKQKIGCYISHPPYFDQTLEQMLDNQSVSAEIIRSVISTYNWQIYDTYSCYKIVSDRDSDGLAMTSVAFQLENMIPGSCALIRKDSIVFLINVTIAQKSNGNTSTVLTEFMRDSFMKCGISTEFCNFTHLVFYYRQSEIALELGSRKDPFIWNYRFEKYALDYLIGCCSRELQGISACHPGLLRLIDYDREKGRDYASTLRVYLECNMNIAQTIRQVYMQRATFLYQIKRIQEIAEINLEDFQTRLYLMLSYQILDQKPVPEKKES